MPNLLDRFSNVRKSTITNPDYIDYIQTISPIGDFTKINNIDVILNSWSNVLMTPRYSYIENPSYGSELYKYVFEPADEDTVDAIKSEIIYSLRFDDRLLVKNIEIKFLSNKKGFVINITAEYQGQSKSIKMAYDESAYFNILKSV